MEHEEIIVEDVDGGYYIAKYVTTKENADENFVRIYKCKEYYHDLELAMEEVKP